MCEFEKRYFNSSSDTVVKFCECLHIINAKNQILWGKNFTQDFTKNDGIQCQTQSCLSCDHFLAYRTNQ